MNKKWQSENLKLFLLIPLFLSFILKKESPNLL